MPKLSYRERVGSRIEKEGFEYAAGALLSGEETPKSLDSSTGVSDPFDLGMRRAITAAIVKGLCKDDRS
ncbi:MAG: hypothetical protein EHM66_00470 [Deltaproteobacteria bacterium]|nr:MAG: hypothetical protein EHM66_00470 [Deltaproteobacteria bacterium]